MEQEMAMPVPLEPERRAQRALSAALALSGLIEAGPMELTETGGGPSVSAPLPTYLVTPGPEDSAAQLIGAARQIGWRYFTQVGNISRIADFSMELEENSGEEEQIPALLDDEDQVTATVTAGRLAEQFAEERWPEITYEARFLRILRRPGNWLWFHSADAFEDFAADFVVSLDGKDSIELFEVMATQWGLEMGEPTESIDWDSEAGG